MQYMGWSWADLMVCPADYVEVIAEEAKRENAEAKAARRQR